MNATATPVVLTPTADSLMDDARTRTGLQNFGDDNFRIGLDHLLATAFNTLDVGEASRTRLLDTIRQRLVSRLEIEAWYRDHPELEQLEVGPVTSITGLPRTGTTALVNLLSLDERFRCLRSWEQISPVPPPIAEDEDRDPRRLSAIRQNEALLRTNPQMAALHLFDPDATEEDGELLGLSFHAQQMALPVFDYHDWWRDADMGPALAYHRRVVKLLQSRRPPDRWLFKAPAHSFFLDALFDTYPDTRVIVTHRDPAKVIPSLLSLLCAMRPEGAVSSLEDFGRRHVEHFRIGTERAMAARARIGEDRFLDVHHQDFVSDPFDTVGKVYNFLGWDLPDALLDRMREWHASNRSNAHGTHHYSPEQFGMTAASIRADFAHYIDRFDIRTGD